MYISNTELLKSDHSVKVLLTLQAGNMQLRISICGHFTVLLTHFFQHYILSFITIGLTVLHVCFSRHLYDRLKGKSRDRVSV